MNIFKLFKGKPKTQERKIVLNRKRNWRGQFVKNSFYSYADLARDIDNEVSTRQVIYV
jgi:hypothetical protein